MGCGFLFVCFDYVFLILFLFHVLMGVFDCLVFVGCWFVGCCDICVKKQLDRGGFGH
jgi:hypothetical protein